MNPHPRRSKPVGLSADLIVIGGGIVGAGVARDAALRGIKTTLVEQHDFASGTSSRSSRLLHGGIRYLAQGKLPLVLEASREKGVIHRIAPHLAEPLPFIFPTFRNTSWPKWKMAIGVRLYDLLCGKHNLGKSSNLSTADIGHLLPQLKTTESTGGVRYFDGFTNDARLVMDTLASASEHGADVRNYTRFIDAQHTGEGWICILEDTRSGERQTIHCRGIVNATGVWTPQLDQSKVEIHPTKGVHLVIDRMRLEVPSAVVVTDADRLLFLIPWGDRTIVGTTDTDYSGSPDHPVCDADDLAYILSNVNEFFPHLKLQRRDILSTWAGVRPLVADKKGNPSDISRKHEIKMPEPGWWDVTGGKLTTYRLIAEQAVDSVIQYLKISAANCTTANLPLLPGAPQVTAHSGCRPPKVAYEIVEHYVTNEWAIHLDDVMIRRTSWCHYLQDPLDTSIRVARWMAELLEWSKEREAEELARYEAEHYQMRACLQDQAQLAEETV